MSKCWASYLLLLALMLATILLNWQFYLCTGSTLHPSCLPTPKRPRLESETTFQPASHAVAYKTQEAQDIPTSQTYISSSLSFATNIPSSFETHSFYPSQHTHTHIMNMHPQPPLLPRNLHIASAIPYCSSIAIQQQPHLTEE